MSKSTKKIIIIAATVALVAAAVLTVCFLTNPSKAADENGKEEVVIDEVKVENCPFLHDGNITAVAASYCTNTDCCGIGKTVCQKKNLKMIADFLTSIEVSEDEIVNNYWGSDLAKNTGGKERMYIYIYFADGIRQEICLLEDHLRTDSMTNKFAYPLSENYLPALEKLIGLDADNPRTQDILPEKEVTSIDVFGLEEPVRFNPNGDDHCYDIIPFEHTISHPDDIKSVMDILLSNPVLPGRDWIDSYSRYSYRLTIHYGDSAESEVLIYNKSILIGGNLFESGKNAELRSMIKDKTGIILPDNEIFGDAHENAHISNITVTGGANQVYLLLTLDENIEKIVDFLSGLKLTAADGAKVPDADGKQSYRIILGMFDGSEKNVVVSEGTYVTACDGKVYKTDETLFGEINKYLKDERTLLPLESVMVKLEYVSGTDFGGSGWHFHTNPDYSSFLKRAENNIGHMITVEYFPMHAYKKDGTFEDNDGVVHEYGYYVNDINNYVVKEYVPE